MSKEGRQARIGIIAELIVIGLVSMAAFALAAHYDLLERVVDWSRRFEAWQVDEFVILIGVLAVALSVFALRRWVDPGTRWPAG